MPGKFWPEKRKVGKVESQHQAKTRALLRLVHVCVCVDVGASVRRVLEIEVPFARGRPWQFDILQIFLGNISLDLVRARSRR